MKNELITVENVTKLATNSCPKIEELIKHTILSKYTTQPHVVITPAFVSSLVYIRATPQSLRNSFANHGVKFNKSAPVIRRHLVLISNLFPELMRHSKDKDGNQILPPYKNFYNKKIVEDYFQFPSLLTNAARKEPKTAIYTPHDHKRDDRFCTDWMVGRRKLNISPDDYEEKLTDNDYFDLELALSTDWETLTTPRPVGRPPKPVDPFNRTETPTQRRTSLKAISEQLDTVTKELSDIKKLLTQD